MIDAALKASRRIIRDFGELDKLQVSRKGVDDFVTKSDLKSSEIILGILCEFADYSVLNEEGGNSDKKGDGFKKYRWIIDPLDGTVNFMHAIPMFAVSIALEEIDVKSGKREIIAGVISLPVMQEVYYAAKGMGAWVEKIGHVSASGQKERVRVSSRVGPSGLLHSFGAIEIGDENHQKRALSLIEQKKHVRYFGSTSISLAFLASGKFDIYFQHSENLWDVAAGILLVKEAGGVVVNFQGENFDLSDFDISQEKYDIVATNVPLLKQLQKNDFFE